jgi:hypothetical protein
MPLLRIYITYYNLRKNLKSWGRFYSNDVTNFVSHPVAFHTSRGMQKTVISGLSRKRGQAPFLLSSSSPLSSFLELDI